MHPLDRVVDVSVQPAAACATLRDTGHRAGNGPGTLEEQARQALLEAHRRCASWAPPEGASLLAGFGGAAFPLLAAAYDLGAVPVRELPRWAEPVVAARSAREGTIAGFGNKTTRPVVRALVEALRPLDTGELDFANLGLALLGIDALDPDRLARVLRSTRVAQPAGHLPDPTTLHDGRRTLAAWGAHRAERILVDAAARPDGLRLLMDAIRYCRHLQGHGPAVLPNRLEELHDLYRSRVASAPAELRRAEPPPRPRTRTIVEAEPPPPRHRIFTPPVRLDPVPDAAALPSTQALRDLHGRVIGGLTFVIPRTAGDLRRWGRLLANCLGDFGPSVVAGRSTIIGIEQANALAFAVEIDTEGAIRQFAGRANRPPGDATRDAVVRSLRAAGLLRAEAVPASTL
jgi:hypothetical protein